MYKAAGIYFRFPDPASAALAKDTFQELGYHPQSDRNNESVLRIRIDGQDLVSALEIAQAHGGILMEPHHAADGRAADGGTVEWRAEPPGNADGRISDDGRAARYVTNQFSADIRA